MPKTWVVVAESSRAKVYELTAVNKPLTEIDAFVHPEARLHEKDLTSDYPGLSLDGKWSGSAHAMGTDESPKEQQALVFSKTIVDYLETNRKRHRFDYLVLMAAPGFLGLMRSRLSDNLKDIIIQEVNNNLVKSKPEGLKRYLPTQLPLQVYH